MNVFLGGHTHVMILNFKISDMDSLTGPRQIRAIDPQAPVIMRKGVGLEEGEKLARE